MHLYGDKIGNQMVGEEKTTSVLSVGETTDHTSFSELIEKAETKYFHFANK